MTNKKKFKLIFVMSIIILSTSTMLVGVSQYSVLFTTVGVAAMLVLSIFVMFLRNKKINRDIFVLFLIVASAIGVMMCINSDKSLNNLFEIFVFFTAIIIVNILNENEFCECFYISMLFIMKFSLIAYLLGLIFPRIIRLFPLINNTMGYPFRYMLFTVLPEYQLGRFSLRNYGPFREPGVFIIFIVITFAIGKKTKQINKFDFFLIILTIVSTLSTSGYVIAIMMVLSMLVEKQKLKSFLLISIGIIIVYLLLSNYTDLLDLNGPVFKKFFVESGSANARFGSVQQNFELMKKYPIIGSGWSAANEFFQNNTFNRHNTNTLLFYFSYYGVVVGLIYVLGIYRFFRFEKTSLNSLMLFAIVCIALCTERLNFDLIIGCIIGYGLLNGLKGEKYNESSLDMQ